jgi:transposase
MKVVIGVDTHKDSHAIVVVDAVGAVLKEFSIQTTSEGYAQAISAVAEYDDVAWGVEGSGSYGRGLVDALLRINAVVYEVPGALTKRHRKHASRRGKSDALDAQAIAEVVLRERDRLPRCQEADEQEAVRILYDRRDRLVRARTETINRLRGAALRLDVRDLPAKLTNRVALQKARRLINPVKGTSYTADALVDEIEEAITDVERLNERIATIEKQLLPFVERLAPSLLELRGASAVVAAGLIGHAGLLANCRDASAFAMRAGVAPVACSSGRNQTVRVNTGGNRQLNRCLHIIALVQVRTSQHAGRAYYQRKRAEGKTHRQAMRSLKRQLATVVFYRLSASLPKPSAGQFAA